MFTKIFALFAMVAVALAAPAPNSAPQVLTYSAGLDYTYPLGASVVSPYAAPVAYSAYPYSYNAGAYYLR